MTPATTVSAIAHDARLNGERLVAPVVISEYPQNRPDTEVPIMPRVPDAQTSGDSLLSEQAVNKLKAQNTQQLLKSNYWFEVANISRWCTTGMIGLTGLTIVNAAGWTAATASSLTFSSIAAGLATAFSGGAVWAALAVLAVAVTVTVKASQFSRRTFVEKSFDVQDTLMQRQAKLMGKSVEQAVAPQHHEAPRESWASRTQASLDQAESVQATR